VTVIDQRGRLLRAAIEVSKQYVKDQVRHLGGPVKKHDINNAIKKVSKVLEELENARTQLKK
jgi:hypothetical protein